MTEQGVYTLGYYRLMRAIGWKPVAGGPAMDRCIRCGVADPGILAHHTPHCCIRRVIELWQTEGSAEEQQVEILTHAEWEERQQREGDKR
jgi:hypothetical protein